jgi:hypothetical protein
MKAPFVIALAALAAGVAPVLAANPPKAKVTPAQAEASALRRIPGKAVSAKYEFEDGHWQYAVLVNARKGGLYEVEVNSTTGKVTDTEKTTAAEEAREAAADRAAAHKAK